MRRKEDAVDTESSVRPSRPVGEAAAKRAPAPVEDFDPEEASSGLRMFANGDTDRSDRQD